jgi:ribosomal-protein-alanine N-acetyltransferase
MIFMPSLVSPVVAAGTLARLDQPVLAGPDFVLRPWQPADAPLVAAAYDDPGIRQWHARSLNLGEALEWISSWPVRWREETNAGWAIAAGDTLLGQLSLRVIKLADGCAQISYWVLPEARGHRIAPRALTVLTAWAFDVLGLHRLEVHHSTLNAASCRVAERAGYPYEGTLRSQALHADGWHDMHVHARIAGDPAQHS